MQTLRKVVPVETITKIVRFAIPSSLWMNKEMSWKHRYSVHFNRQSLAWPDVLEFSLFRINIAKMVILPQVAYKSNTIPISIPLILFT